MIYYDDVEVCNPLGSRAKTHKLGTCSVQLIHCIKVVMHLYSWHAIMQLYFTTHWETFLQGIDLHYKLLAVATFIQIRSGCHLGANHMKDIKSLEKVHVFMDDCTCTYSHIMI